MVIENVQYYDRKGAFSSKVSTSTPQSTEEEEEVHCFPKIQVFIEVVLFNSLNFLLSPLTSSGSEFRSLLSTLFIL